MKKVFFLAFFATMCISFVIAMPVKDSCPCPVPTIINIPQPQPVVKTKKVLPPVLPVQRKEPGIMISGSFNTTTNNYYSTPTSQIGSRYVGVSNTDAFFLIFLLALLFALLLFVLFRTKNNTLPDQVKVDVHNHIPSAPQPKMEHRSDGLLEKEAIEKAAVSGGSFQKRADGSWRVDFPKPSEKTDENKKENEVH